MSALWSRASLEVEPNSQGDEEKQASEANGPVRGTQARGFADDHQKNHAGAGPNDQRDEGGDQQWTTLAQARRQHDPHAEEQGVQKHPQWDDGHALQQLLFIA